MTVPKNVANIHLAAHARAALYVAHQFSKAVLQKSQFESKRAHKPPFRRRN